MYNLKWNKLCLAVKLIIYRNKHAFSRNKKVIFGIFYESILNLF